MLIYPPPIEKFLKNSKCAMIKFILFYILRIFVTNKKSDDYLI